MTIINIAIVIFIIMESANVIILYFAPNFKMGNGVAVFNPWHTSKQNKENELFAKYMVNWVAGCKLIFIALLAVILLVGNSTLKIVGVVVIIISISTYFLGLHPIIKQLDSMGQITPKGYSKTLAKMIAGFMVMFSTSLVIYFLF